MGSFSQTTPLHHPCSPEAQALFGALLSTDTEANGVYSMDQVTWMQQMYYQYFMQLLVILFFKFSVLLFIIVVKIVIVTLINEGFL